MELILIPICIFFAALIFSMFGMGGGLFYMPLFLFFLKDHADASLLSFLCIFVTAISAMSVYHRKGLIDWRLVKYLGTPLVTVVFVTGFLSKNAPNAVLRNLLGATLVLAGIFMITVMIKQGRRNYYILPIISIPQLAIFLMKKR